MRKTMMGWVGATVAVATVFIVPSAGWSQASPGAERAAELEFEASELLDQQQHWAAAVDLYLAAVQLRDRKDPKAQEDLLIVANLNYETGNTAGAIAALESASSRVLARGDVMGAASILTDAVWVAQRERLQTDQRRLTLAVAEMVNSSELSRAEKNQILSRFRGA